MSICQGVGEGSSWEVGGEGSLEMSPRLTALWEQEGPGNAIGGVTGVVGTGPGLAHGQCRYSRNIAWLEEQLVLT